MKVVEKLCIREKVNFEKRTKYMMYEMPNLFQIVIIICTFGDFFLSYNDINCPFFFCYMQLVHPSLNNIFYKHDHANANASCMRQFASLQHKTLVNSQTEQ